MTSINDVTNQAGLRALLKEMLTEYRGLQGSVTWDAASVADGDEVVQEITVTGAALGDFVLVSGSLDVTDLALVGAVTAADTVTVQLLNNTGGAIDLASMTAYVRVIPRTTTVTTGD